MKLTYEYMKTNWEKHLKDGVFTVPEGTTVIGKNAFAIDNMKTLKEVLIPDSVKEICNFAFVNQSIEKVRIPNSVTKIGIAAFKSCKELKEVTLPNKLMTVRRYAFHNCRSLEKVIIPNTVKKIYDCAFSSCVSLKEVVLPAGAMFECDMPFYNCQNLKKVIEGGVEYTTTYDESKSNDILGYKPSNVM